MNNHRYPPHGGMHLSIHGQLLSIYARGPVNVEMLIKYQRDVGAFREQLIQGGPWVSIMRWQGQAILPAEAESMTIAFINKAVDMKLCATAVVLAEADYPAVSGEYWRTLYGKTRVHSGVFTDDDAAMSFLSKAFKETTGKRLR